ncbi:hypothetical protein J2W47_000015 [Priestia megaterium]|nr:hypothetical protein [Priestia megaterium]
MSNTIVHHHFGHLMGLDVAMLSLWGHTPKNTDILGVLKKMLSDR